MAASMRDRPERERQSLLTFRLSAIIVVLIALLGWMLADRYFDLGAVVGAFLEAPTTSPLNSKPDKNPTCNAEAASKMGSSVWTGECPAASSSSNTPTTTTIVAGTKTKNL
jgi:hypothetical protein